MRPRLAFGAAVACVAWTLAWASCGTAFAEVATLDWEKAFPVEWAAKDVYLDAHFVGSDGAAHRLQLWRHGSEFLHRRTDEVVDLYLRQVGNQGDYAYRLIDHRRHLAMDVSRNQLYRIGVFSDWFGLAHVLDRPKAEFKVRAVARLYGSGRPMPTPPGCEWRLLVRGGKQNPEHTYVCWSAKWGLPMSIRARGANGEWTDQFSVDRVEVLSTAMAEVALPPVPVGYASFDAGREIDPKQGD